MSMTEPIRVAYADPPYIGMARKHYKSDEVDHEELIAHLVTNYPDGWALSSHEPGLGPILDILKQHGLSTKDNSIRVSPWVKPFAIFRPGVNPGFTWEPVIWRGGRKHARKDPTIRDWVSANITLKKGLSGAKPDTFSFWLFSLLNLRPGDILDDLFPGTYAVTNAWCAWQEQYTPRGETA